MSFIYILNFKSIIASHPVCVRMCFLSASDSKLICWEISGAERDN